ncbi:uncharacterized protein LOC143540137 [Bidens hawaiensis]|uniref:uncharacterized protein LOC143540137 n=1 Tax=Bidens hawaiensis TaxID=980011 RepID=UPI00404A9B90
MGFEQTGIVETEAEKSTNEDFEEMPTLIETPGPVEEMGFEKTGIVETEAEKSTIEDFEEMPTVIETPGPVEEMGFEQTGLVETEAEKSTSEDFEEMPTVIETPGPVEEMGFEQTGLVETEAEKSTSEDFEEMPTVIETPGPVEEMGFEQTGIVETEAEKSTSEDFEEMPTLIETPEPEKPRNNAKFNLRKSLAWDSAFFTSDGVLDADELSTMIEVGEKSVKHQLPGIEEEVYKSMDSISTFESDNLSLDCLEAELFEDIRASIQKSNKSTNVNNLSIKTPLGKKDFQPKISSSSKKVDLDSGKRLGARTKDNISSIPQPKIVNRLNLNQSSTSALTKRASLSVSQAKRDQDAAKKAHVTQKGSQIAKPTTIQGSKLTGVIGPRRAVPKPSISSKPSFLGSSTTLKTDPTRPSSSSSSCSSGTDVKANISRKKVVSKTTKLTAGSVIPKTPSRVSMNNKQQPASRNIFSSISPASSISDWSPESRGSSVDTSVSYRSFNGDTAVQSALSNLPMPRTSSQNGCQTGSLSRPPTAQPTGLRMPSPKIGFFDAGKTGVRTPTAGGIRSQSTLPNGPTTLNSAKFGKIPPSKATVTHANMKPNPQKTVPKPSQEQPPFKPKAKSNMAATSDVLDNKSDDNTSITDGTRTPFAVKNSVSDTNGIDMEVTEKSVNFPLLESQQNENSEVV